MRSLAPQRVAPLTAARESLWAATKTQCSQKERNKRNLLPLKGNCEAQGCCSVAKSCPILCIPMNCSLVGSSVHGIFQGRILEWVAISFSRGSSQPRDQTCISCTGRWVLYHWALGSWRILFIQMLSCKMSPTGMMRKWIYNSVKKEHSFTVYVSYWSTKFNVWLNLTVYCCCTSLYYCFVSVPQFFVFVFYLLISLQH